MNDNIFFTYKKSGRKYIPDSSYKNQYFIPQRKKHLRLIALKSSIIRNIKTLPPRICLIFTEGSMNPINISTFAELIKS